MNTNRITNILDDCEKELRKAVGEVLAEGDYATARKIMAWAENVAAMAAAARTPNNPSPKPALKPTSPSTQPRTHKGRPAADQYPRFERRGDELVKIGWSKSDRKEYCHRAPKHAVEALLATLKRIASAGNNFTSDDLIPLKDSDSDGVFPTYQVFVALAWLRNLNLVVQHGRKGGYTLIMDRPLDATVDNAWSELTIWRG